MKKTTQFMTVMAVLVASCLVAEAVGVDVRYVSASPAQAVQVVHPFSSGTWYQTGMIQLEVDFLDGNGPTAVSGFCIDLKQSASHSFQPYDLNPLEAAPVDGGSPYSPMGPAKADAIRELWGEHFADAQTGAVQAAAFQVALWEIIYENDGTQSPNALDAGTGRHRVNDAAVAVQANSWLAQIGDASQVMQPDLFAVTNFADATLHQDFVLSLGLGSTPPIPEPLTVATAIVSMCGLGVYTRRRTSV